MLLEIAAAKGTLKIRKLDQEELHMALLRLCSIRLGDVRDSLLRGFQRPKQRVCEDNVASGRPLREVARIDRVLFPDSTCLVVGEVRLPLKGSECLSDG